MSQLTLPAPEQNQTRATWKRPSINLRAWLREYSFAFAALLAIVLFVMNLVLEKSPFAVSDQLANFAPFAIAAMASAPAILSGAFDFTTSPLLFFANGVFVVWLYENGLTGWYALPIVLLITTAVGVAQGLIVLILRAQTVVVTLALYFVLIGVDFHITPRATPLGHSWVRNLGDHVGPIPGGLITIGAPLVIWSLLRLFPIFHMMYAVGSNEATAFSAGVRVSSVQIFAYGLGGLFAGIGGLAFTGLTGTASSLNVTSYTLIAISAVVLGGNSLWGGRGTLIGPLLGAASIFLLQDVLVDFNVNPSWLQVTYGLLLIGAVLLSGVLTIGKKGKSI